MNDLIKKCVVFSLTSVGTLKYHYIIKTIEMFDFQLLINSSVTIGCSFLMPIISAIISKTIIKLLILFNISISCISCEYSIKAIGSP